MRILVGLMTAGLIAGLAGPAAALSSLGASRRATPVAYAKVDMDTSTVLTFGGKGTVSATASCPGFGYCDITFNGVFPTDISADKVIITALAQSYSYGVANAYVYSAQPNQIGVEVYNWKSDDLSYATPSPIFVTLHIGR
ncbi:MAG TPA: hypothetical protein VFD92_13110 [Candidatus Binatia bacterium]|nr:hypothetical protein [Candidatus Binatia bacterium]